MNWILIPFIFLRCRNESLAESMQGNFEGIGVQFRMIRDTIAVSRVLEGGPSERAGIKVWGPYSDGRPRHALLERIAKRSNCREAEGQFFHPSSSHRLSEKTRFDLHLRHSPWTCSLAQRQRRVHDRSKHRLHQDQSFFPNHLCRVSDLFDLGLLEQQMNDLILDLRGNPGGYLLPAKQIADDFLEASKPIVIVEGNNGKRERSGFFLPGALRDEAAFLFWWMKTPPLPVRSLPEPFKTTTADSLWVAVLSVKGWCSNSFPWDREIRFGSLQPDTTPLPDDPSKDPMTPPVDRIISQRCANRYQTGEMGDPSKNPCQRQFDFYYSQKEGPCTVGGGITPDIYIANLKTVPKRPGTVTLIGSNLIDLFVFLELDKHPKKFDFDNAPQFFNEESALS